MPQAAAIFCTIVGAIAALCMLVLLMAGGANSSPTQLMQIKWMMIGTALVGLAGVVGGIWAVVAGKPWIGAGIGIAPLVIVVVLIIVLVRLEW